MKKYVYGGIAMLIVMISVRYLWQYFHTEPDGETAVEQSEEAEAELPDQENDREKKESEELSAPIKDEEVTVHMEEFEIFAAEEEGQGEPIYPVSNLRTRLFLNDEEMARVMSPADIDDLQDAVIAEELALPEDARFLEYDATSGNITYESRGETRILVWSEDGYRLEGEEDT